MGGKGAGKAAVAQLAATKEQLVRAGWTCELPMAEGETLQVFRARLTAGEQERLRGIVEGPTPSRVTCWTR